MSEDPSAFELNLVQNEYGVRTSPVVSIRLAAVTDYVPTCESVADVGTDHGYASARLLAEKRCNLVFATDISHKALSRAKTNLTQMGFADRVRFVLGDGIIALEDCEPKPSAIMIAGMGAQSIVDILDDGCAALARLGDPILSLSPNRDPELVRHWLNSHGYAVSRERVVCSAGRWYPVLRADYFGGVVNESDPRLLYLGQTALPPLTDDARRYWTWRLGVLKAQLPGGDKMGCGAFGSLADRIVWVEGVIEDGGRE
ncbi:MAG: class I SAM-dependent methyltransferase [Oscillospiraceae bacterium]|jgi:tRNA (adenine22-N1)-methyltransferase|nr:class I SAM-dependent methyltransferase [Oscillospiraceae bacterium]